MAIRWQLTEVRSERKSSLASKVPKALDEATSFLPDLRKYPGALDKARVLLESAAEIEHMLLIQYLYAALSLKSGGAVLSLTLEQQKSVREWARVVKGIAIDEMGHLMTVQNVRLLVGEDPTFDREEFPPKADVYPFELHLEPLSRRSLAKYVLAEAPLNADADLEEYIQIVGTRVRHVGVVYGLLAVVFSSTVGFPPENSEDGWDQFVRLIAEKCGAIERPAEWQISDADLRPQSFELQGNHDDFVTENTPETFFVRRVRTLEECYVAFREIGLQGEAPVETADGVSHFRRFKAIFDGRDGVLAFPNDASFIPSFEMGVDPKLTDYAEPALGIAQRIDTAYANMLQALRRYLSADFVAQRKDLAEAALQEMQDIRRLTRDLVTKKQGAGSSFVASPVFTVPKV